MAILLSVLRPVLFRKIHIASLFACYSKIHDGNVNNNDINKQDDVLLVAARQPNDVLDEFTTDLLRKKVFKWENIRYRLLPAERKQEPIQLAHQQLCNEIDMAGATNQQIDDTFTAALALSNPVRLRVLCDQAIAHVKCPSSAVFINLLGYFSQIGDKRTLDTLIELCGRVNPELLLQNANFAHYIAEAISVNGDTSSAIALFARVYDENVYLRRRVRFMLKYVVLEIVDNKSEASLVALLQFIELLLQRYGDSYPLFCLWEACFLSEWYSEQVLALDLLTKYPQLLEPITRRINYLVMVCLRRQQDDAVMRFLEYLLRSNFVVQYSIVIITMFEYNVRKRNFTVCVDIINWAKTYNIRLPAKLEDEYLNLILQQMRSNKMTTVPTGGHAEYKF